jgi:hypothetical protein
LGTLPQVVAARRAPGRHFYACHLTFEDQPAVQRLVLDYQAALAGLGGLDLIPGRGLHLTMQGIGFTDQISDREIAAVMARSEITSQRSHHQSSPSTGQPYGPAPSPAS